MAAIEELRELVSSADRRWASLEVEGRMWQDRLAAREAVGARSLDRVPLSSGIGGELSASPQGEREQTWHLWRDGVELVRSEYSIGAERVTVVGNSSGWSRWSPTLGLSRGGGAGRPVRLMLGPPGILLTASDVLEQLEISELSERAVAQRQAFFFRGRPNVNGVRGRVALREAGSGADEYEIAIDAERGLLLSLAALRANRPFQVVEVSRVAFDQPLSPDLFAAGESADSRPARPESPGRLSADTIADQLDFDLLLPPADLSPVAPHVTLSDAGRRGLGPRHVVLIFVIVDPEFGRGQLRITEAKSELPRGRTEQWEREGDFEVCEERHGRVQRRRLRALRSGVFVEIESAVLPLDRLIEVLEGLSPQR